MIRKIGSLVLAILALFFALDLNAQVNLLGDDLTNLPDQLQQQGWQQVAPGVFQRQRPNQPIETLAIGSDGLARAVQEVRHRLVVLRESFDKNPTADVERTLGHLKDQLAELEKTISALESNGPSQVINGCDFSFGCAANAYPLSSIQGVGANSSSYFNNNCYYSGTAYADAYGYTNSGTDFQSRFPNGSNVSASAAISVPGGPSCFSDSYSYVDVPSVGIYYSCYQSNNICPPAPLGVDLYGPSYITVFGYECVTEYWSASAHGGTPPYSFSWSTSYGGGSGDSFSITFCGGGATYTEYVNVSVTAYDSGGQTATKSMTTQVRYQGDQCQLYRPFCEPAY
jgi:hypothetical protein